MRKLVLTLSMALTVIAVFARDAKKTYNKSVFYEAQRTLAGNKETAQGNISKAKNIFPGWAVYTDKLSGDILDMYGKAIDVNGNSASEKAGYVIGNMLANVGIKETEWQKVKEADGKKADHINYMRVVAGHRVMFSKLGLRFAKDGKLERIQLRTYGQPVQQTPSLSREAVMAASAETADIPEIIISSKEVKQDWLWFPVPNANGYSLHPAWEVIVKASAEGSVPMQLRCYIDGIDGKLLYRTNDVKEAVDATIKGSVYKTSILTPPTLEPLENLTVSSTISSYYTNNLGFISEPLLSVPASLSVSLSGKWSVVNDDPTSQIPIFVQNVTSLGGTYIFPASTRHVSAYYHVNKVHDFMKSYFPAFPNLDFPLETNVDLTSGTCNAFYNGSSINFFAAGGGCNSLTETPDVVYHEYGHGISDQYYNFMGMFTIQNGALNEACSDIWGISITGIPINGNGAFTTIPGGGSFRRYDMEPKIYPRDLIEEVHGDGEIVAGCWWDVAVNLGSVPDMTQLFTLTYDDTPDGPDGTEGQVYHDVLVSALMNDDNDNNLNNGTPHFSQIIKAFAKHGIYLLGEVNIAHKELVHQPAFTEIAVAADLDIQDPTFFQNTNVYYRNRDNGTWNTVPTTVTGNTYTAKIPPQPAGAIIDYYFQLYTLQSQVNGTFPLMYDSTAANAHKVTIPYQFAVHVVSKDSNTFEGAVSGWAIGNAPGDDATTGIWIQAKPVASFAGASVSTVYTSQPGSDNTTGAGKCLITGNSSSSTDPVGDNDVDNGNTTVVTPVFNLSNYINPMIEYHRWYADSKGGNAHNDPWVVRVGNSASGNWKVVDSTYASDYNWRRRIFAVKSYLSTLNDVQLQFRASDSVVATLRNDGQSVTEAGLDDFFIYDRKPLGVNDPAMQRAIIAPNPADESVNIIVSGKYKGTAALYDVTGKTVSSVALDEAHSNYSLSTRQLAPGQYVLVINTGETIQSQKIIIQHH